MTREEFEKIIEEEFPRAVPEKFHKLLKNVAFLVDGEAPDGDLLGLYHGISHVDRGDWYGVGGTLPDTITLYQKTIEDEATRLSQTNKLEFVGLIILKLLEGFKKLYKQLSIRRKGMLHELCVIVFTKKPGLPKPAGVFPDSFWICFDSLDNLLKCYAWARCNKKQYLDAVVVGYTLKMPLHLSGSF